MEKKTINFVQLLAAQMTMTMWLKQQTGFVFEDVEYEGTIERHGMVHYIFRFRRGKEPWRLGVAGGYISGNDIGPHPYVGSKMDEFQRKTMEKKAALLVDMMHDIAKASASGEKDQISRFQLQPEPSGTPLPGGRSLREETACQVLFVPATKLPSMEAVQKRLRETWYAREVGIQEVSRAEWQITLDGYTFFAHVKPVPVPFQEELRRHREPPAPDMAKCPSIVAVSTFAERKELFRWCPLFVKLVDSLMEVCRAPGVLSGRIAIDREEYGEHLLASLKRDQLPIFNFCHCMMTEKNSREIVIAMNGTGSFGLAAAELHGIYDDDWEAWEDRWTLDLIYLTVELIVGKYKKSDGFCRGRSGLCYYTDDPQDPHRRDGIAFHEWGYLLDDVEDVQKIAGRKGLSLKKIAEAMKRVAWFTRWACEADLLYADRKARYEAYLNRPAHQGDWRYAAYYAGGMGLASDFIRRKARFFAEDYYSVKATKGYKKDLAAYAKRKLKGTKWEAKARLAGQNAFAYLPWDEETYHDVAAIIGKRYEEWQKAHPASHGEAAPSANS